MKSKLSNNPIDYNGSQLCSGWIKKTFGLEGAAIVAFTGGCDVDPKYMVDLEDLEAGETIYSEEMLHFIIEHPGIYLTEATLRQRILVCLVKEVFEELVPGISLTRDGDDLYEGKAKLTISVATVSDVSGLIHTGINISSKNTPVSTKSLKDYSIDTRVFASLVLEKYLNEFESIRHCASKVRKVK